MKTISETAPLTDRFQYLLDVLSSDRFLHMKGIANEVPFFICPYLAKEAVEMDRIRRQLISQLEMKGLNILNIDLYDLSVSLLQERGLWDRILDTEPETAKPQFLELLQGILDPEAHLIPAMAKEMESQPFDMLFISSVGEVFPFIRSHNLLNNLQSRAKEKPTLLFFPGSYTQSLEKGSSLDLFGRLHDDNYYRATKIYHYAV
ncbi:MAG: DUF1788 domain-containing protein [Kiritimatiellae bacterium]|jgi:hypothetical protein|nr:DUF1788 domain-containing protein [Kiritimatiellia bacterium]